MTNTKSSTETALPSHTSEEVVLSFLSSLELGDYDAAARLLALEASWQNVGYPTVRGRHRIIETFKAGGSRGVTFWARTHHLGVSADGSAVLTERTDYLQIGPLVAKFWVCGTFEVRDQLIVEWRDYFSASNVMKGVFRGSLRALMVVASRRG